MQKIRRNHLYFLRHCTTENNEKGIISGRQDMHIKNAEIVDCTELDYLNDMVILSSSSMRCRETVYNLFRNLRFEIPTVYIDQLLERSMGVFEGKIRDELVEEFPEYFIEDKFIYNMTPPQGESYEEICERADMFVDKILIKEIKRKNVLVCSHNQFLKLLYFKLLEEPVEKKWYQYNFKNGKVYKIW